MQIIKNRQIIDNPWQLKCSDTDPDSAAKAGETTPLSRPTIIPLSHWLAIRGHVDHARQNFIGILLQPEDDLLLIENDIPGIPLIALDFSRFSEGRGYSQAIRLRQQFHYIGEIRAIGAFVDNLSIMEKCGINAFQLAKNEPLEEALGYFDELHALPYH